MGILPRDRASHGNRRTHLRPPVCVAAAILVCGAAAATAADARPGRDRPARTRHLPRRRHFQRAAAGAVARAVLTDYEHIPRFMPDVRAAGARAHGHRRLVVEQEAIGAVLILLEARSTWSSLSRQAAGTIRFRDRCGQSFDVYDGGWTLTSPQTGGTTIEYVLTAKPAFDVPEFLLKRLLKRDSTEMIRRLQTEIASRDR